MAKQQVQKVSTTQAPVSSAPIPLLQPRAFSDNEQSSIAESPQAEMESKPDGVMLGHSLARINTRPLSHLPIQPKLTIGQVGDPYEQEADRVAAQVVSQIHAPASPAIASPKQQPNASLRRKALGQPIQRSEAIEVEEEELQMKPADTVQREATPEEEELQMKPVDSIQRETTPEEEELQMKPTIQRQSDVGGLPASNNIESAINQSRGGGQAMPDTIRQPMEQAFGADFSNVRVHTDAQSDQLSRSINAQAFTTKNDIFFSEGKYNPGSRSGQELLAHELTHVVQQNGSGVQRRIQPAVHSTPAIQAKLSHVQQASSNVIQRDASTMNIKGVLIGQTNLYSGAGQQVGTIKKGTQVVIEKAEDEGLMTETSGGAGSKHKELWQILDVIDMDGLTLNGGSLDDLWISKTRVTEQAASGGDSETVTKIKAFADTLANYYVIHKKYKQYAEFIGSKTWNTFHKIWGYVNKVLSWVGKVDPSGITAIVGKVSEAIHLIAGYITEVVRLMDETLLEEVSPLIPPGFSFGTLKDACGELKTAVTTAWDAVEAVVEAV